MQYFIHRPKGTKLSRTDSVRTQTSIQLLDENLCLFDSLQVQADKCRQLESALEDIDDQLDDVLRSRHELTRLKREEESEEDVDEKLIRHLNRKLVDLERQQIQLKHEQVHMQVSNELIILRAIH